MALAETIELTRYFEFLDSGAIKIRGHRLGIEHILGYYLDGYSAEEIAEEFPGLGLKVIYATITYYLTIREEVDNYLQQRRLRDERDYQQWQAAPSALIERLRAHRQKHTHPE